MTMTAQHHQLALAPSQPPTQLTFANRKAAFPQKLWEMLNPPPVEPGQESPIHGNPIRWSDDGTSFYVVDPERLRTDVLGRWFKHANFNSFVRQLNMYGFQKCSPLQQGALVPTATENYVHFSHPLFHRDHPELVEKITRKKAGDKGTSAAPLPAVTSPLLGTTLPAITGAEPPAPIGRTPSQYLAIEAQAYEPPEEPEEIATTVGNVAGRNNNEVVEVRQVANGLSAIKRAQATIQADLESLKQSNQDLWREAIVAREKAQKQEHMLQQIVKFLEHQYGRRRSGGTPETVPRDIDRTSSPVPSNPRKRPRLMINDSSDSVGHSGATSDRFQAMDTPGSSIAPASYFSPAPVSPTSTEARTPGPTLSTTESNALTHYIPPTTASNAEASLQQLLSSPEQYHALMRALAMHNPTAFSAAMPTSSLQPEPAAENELQLSNRWDFSQIGQSIPTGTSTNNNLSSTSVIPDPTSTNVSALAPQLAPYAQQIASTSKLGEKINQVDEMQSSLDEMMALIGVDPSNPFAGNPDTTMDDLNTQAQEDADRGFASMSDPQSAFPTESLNFNPDTDWDTFLKFAMTDPNSFDGNMGTNTNDHILRDGAFLDEVASQHSSDPTTSPAVPPHDLFGSENGDISMESAEPGTTDTTNSKRKTGSSQIGSKASNRQPRLETSPRTPRRKQ